MFDSQEMINRRFVSPRGSSNTRLVETCTGWFVSHLWGDGARVSVTNGPSKGAMFVQTNGMRNVLSASHDLQGQGVGTRGQGHLLQHQCLFPDQQVGWRWREACKSPLPGVWLHNVFLVQKGPHCFLSTCPSFALAACQSTMSRPASDLLPIV